jgi:hypothetical protein
MKQDFRTVHIRIDNDVYTALSTLVNPKFPSISFIIRKILRDYVEGVKTISEVKPLQSLGPLKLPGESQEQSRQDVVPEIIGSTGIGSSFQRPIRTEKRRVHPEISLIRRAYRAMRSGKEYDKEMEPFFDLVINKE